MGNKAVDLAGHMMCIPDLAAVWYSAILSSNDGTFRNPPPSLAKAKQLLRSNNQTMLAEVPILDPHNMTPQEITEWATPALDEQTALSSDGM